MKIRKLSLASIVYAAFLLVCPLQDSAAADGVAPAAAGETLIYMIREKRFMGGGVGFWIAVNDQTVARVRNKKYAVIRAKAGRISLNLAIQGSVIGSIALDDRPGETVYLKFRLGDTQITEIDPGEAQKMLRKYKMMDPIDEIRPNNEEVKALINLSNLRGLLIHPTSDRLEPDAETAIISIFRRIEKVEFNLGIWSLDGYVATLRDGEGIDIRVAPGEHTYLAGNTGTTIMQANVEAGRRYYAWMDYGKMVGRVKLVPISTDERKDLDKWLPDVDWVEVDETAITPRLGEREQIILEYLHPIAERARMGDVDKTVLGAEHAF